ncbi:MAG: hypothetical protein GVY20_12420 [Bacteroidetes bacterium]|jgi:hypothetical protein|nr:hypothetical protein [Bacteroidota bacterium]
MNRENLYIHIGTQKTGSTTLQTILSKNKQKLLKEGICYLGRFPKLARRIRTITQFDEVLAKELNTEIRRAIDSDLRKGLRSYVISNEKFSGDKMISYRNAEAVAGTLKYAVEDLSFNLKIIIYLRRQDTYIESTYAQKVYSGYTGTFDEFMGHFGEDDFHWDQFLGRYANVFGEENLIVYPFDKKYLPKSQSLIHHFGKSIGSKKLANFSDKAVANKRFTRNSLNIALITNHHLGKYERRRFREILKEHDEHLPNNKFFSTEERERFLSNYRQSNQRVAETYLNHLGDKLFSTPDYSKIDAKRVDENPTTEELLASLAQITLNLSRELKDEREAKDKENKTYRLMKKIRSFLRRLIR